MHFVVCRRTTRKAGPNQGRDFFVCMKPQESRCDFFIWADAQQGPSTWNTSLSDNSGSTWSDSKRKKVKQKGRKFYQDENDCWFGGPNTVQKRKCSNCQQIGQCHVNRMLFISRVLSLLGSCRS